MKVPAKIHELGIEKIVFGPVSCKGDIKITLSKDEVQERTAYVLNAIAVHDELLAALEQIAFCVGDGSIPLIKADAYGMVEIARAAVAKARGIA